jgi:hypothetical protein
MPPTCEKLLIRLAFNCDPSVIQRQPLWGIKRFFNDIKATNYPPLKYAAAITSNSRIQGNLQLKKFNFNICARLKLYIKVWNYLKFIVSELPTVCVLLPQIIRPKNATITVFITRTYTLFI